MKYLTILCSLFIVGCGYVRTEITNFDEQGNVTSVNKASYLRVGSGELNKVDADIKTGKFKIGSQKGSGGAMAETALNLSKVLLK